MENKKEIKNKCPYCQVRELSNRRIKLKTESETIIGKGECGAYLDIGQQSVEVNSYVEIYKGAIQLMEDLVDNFNYWLEYFGVNVEEYTENGENPIISISTSDIIDKLFLGRYGGTTKRNFINALGIKED